MNKNVINICLISIIVAAFIGCSSKKEVVDTDKSIKIVKDTTAVHVISTKPANYIPKAVAYQTNGDYDNNVMITLDASRQQPLSYPAPSDINVNSAPLSLGNGWLLDRRGGISANSVFLKYTYSEYSKLKSAPTAQQLMQNIIPGASVTRIVTLPININEAKADPQSVIKYLPEK